VNAARAAVMMAAVVVLLVASPTVALAHGDLVLVDEVLELAPGRSAAFDGDVHYHRVVGTVSADGPVGVRLVDGESEADVLTFGPATELAFNELVRCCDQAWTPHTLLVENVGEDTVTVAARARLVHDDLAVMVDGVESGTRLSIALLGLGWSGLVLGASRRPRTVPLRRSMVGLAVLAVFVLALGGYAAIRYGVGGAPSVVAGNADLPVIPMNRIVSRASLLMGLSLLAWGLVGLWWVRAGSGSSPRSWAAMGLALAGTVLVVAVAILAAYGGPPVQTAWFVVAAGPVLAVLARRPSPVPEVPAER